MQRLRQGDLSVANEIIEGHILLAFHIVGRYLKKQGNYDNADDFESIALLAVTAAVHRARTELVNDEITPYIVVAIHSAVHDAQQSTGLVSVPCRTYRLHKGRVTPLLRHKGEYDKEAKGDFVKKMAIRELLYKACQNSVDRKIIEMRLKNYQFVEIAPIVGLNAVQVNRAWSRIVERFKNRNTPELLDELGR